MKVVIIPDMHLEIFSKEDRRILLNKFIQKLLREKFDLLIFNGDFYAGGKRNRGKVIGLLHRLERTLKRKIIHFPGSHEDFSHSYRFKYYENFIAMIPGSQFIASHGQRPVHIDFLLFEDLLEKERIDLLITHDPLPETVDYTIFFSNEFVIPASFLVEKAIGLYRKEKSFRKRVDKWKEKIEISDDFLDLMMVTIDVINEERKILSKILDKDLEIIQPKDKEINAIAILSFLHGIEMINFGPAVHFEWMYQIKEKILDIGITFVVSGHIHENMFFNDKIIKMDRTTFCNPGPGYLGNYCVVDLDKKKIKTKSII